MSCTCILQVLLVLAVSCTANFAIFPDQDKDLTRARWTRQGKYVSV